MTANRSVLRSTASLLMAAALVLPGTVPARAHGPDPIVGGSLWRQDQSVTYRWRSGQVPPAWMASEINAAAAASNGSRASRAAAFAYSSSGASSIAYGEPTGCGTNGIACFDRSGAPSSFRMAFRAHGHVFDWGTLRWCQAYEAWPDGCYDVETVALDEFGHVEVLGHHVNYADDRDYLDAVVQTYSRTKPRPGWSAHRYGRCDTATLQRKYDVPNSWAEISTCLDLNTYIWISASETSVAYRAPVTFTATLRVVGSSSYERLSVNPLSGRTVVIQRRPIGQTAWTTVASMNDGAAPATYVHTAYPTASYEWRAVFWTPAGEGLNGSSSGPVRVSVGPCTGACPSEARRTTPQGRGGEL